jgi:hypothetical protein
MKKKYFTAAKTKIRKRRRAKFAHHETNLTDGVTVEKIKKVKKSEV